MRETRKIDIQNRRFSRSDILGLARLFVEQAELSRKGNRHYVLSLALTCSDGTHYESESLELFEEGGTADTKPPKAVEFSFQDYQLGRRLNLSLLHGGGYRDSFEIKGDEPKWVHDIFVTGQERLNSLQPTETWWKRHPLLTQYLIAIGIGTIALYVVAFLLANLPIALEFKKDERTLLNILLSHYPFLIILLRLGFTLLLGFFLGAWAIQEWFLKAWPTIDLDFGPEHFKKEKQRRSRLCGIMFIIIIPFLLNIFSGLLMPLLF